MLLVGFWKSVSVHYLHLEAKLCLENFDHIIFMRFYKPNAEKSSVALFFKGEQGAEGRGKPRNRERNLHMQMHVSVFSINNSSVHLY